MNDLRRKTQLMFCEDDLQGSTIGPVRHDLHRRPRRGGPESITTQPNVYASLSQSPEAGKGKLKRRRGDFVSPRDLRERRGPVRTDLRTLARGVMPDHLVGSSTRARS